MRPGNGLPRLKRSAGPLTAKLRVSSPRSADPTGNTCHYSRLKLIRCFRGEPY
jgi:hypothetical protein